MEKLLSKTSKLQSLLIVLLLCSNCHFDTKSSDKKQVVASTLQYTEEKVDSNFYEVEKNHIKIEDTNFTPQPKQEAINIIGVWSDDFNDGILYRIVKNNKDQYLLEMGESNSTDKWIRFTSLVKSNRKGETIYEDKESGRSEYYKVDKNGNMSVFDDLGYITTHKRLK